MSIELLFNLLLLVFFGACFADISRVKNLPGSDIMGAAIWPQIILGLLMVMLLINIAAIVKANKRVFGKFGKLGKPGKAAVAVIVFLKSELFKGIALIAAMSLLLEPLGFVITVFMFLCAYGRLLGRRNPVSLVFFSLIATFLLFFIFSKGLSVILPRGYGVIRNFSLMLESI